MEKTGQSKDLFCNLFCNPFEAFTPISQNFKAHRILDDDVRLQRVAEMVNVHGAVMVDFLTDLKGELFVGLIRSLDSDDESVKQCAERYGIAMTVVDQIWTRLDKYRKEHENRLNEKQKANAVERNNESE